MERREFIKKTTVTGVFLSGLSSVGILGFGAVPAGGIAENKEYPVVGICGSDDPELGEPLPLDSLLTSKQVRDIVWRALDRDTSLRSLTRIVNKDSWVVIKPNIVVHPGLRVNNVRSHESFLNWEGVPDINKGLEHWGLVTDLRVVKAVAEYLIDRIGPRRITVAEGGVWYRSGGKYKKEKFEDGWTCPWKGFGNLSYTGMVDELNQMRSGTSVDIVDLNEDEAVYVTDYDPYKTGMGAFQYVPHGDPDGTSATEPTRRRGIYLPRTIMERDILITVPVLKTHSSVGVTLCLKNLIGCVHSQSYGDQNQKAAIHRGSPLNLTRGIADLACAIRPDYGVAEGFWATRRMFTGQNGVNTNHNIVIVGSDIVAVEAVAMMAMGFNPLDSDLLRMCHMKKLGQWHPDMITIAGPPVSRISLNYDRSPNVRSTGESPILYTARGIRKWMMLGPVKSPIGDFSQVMPEPGRSLGGNVWTLLDGDAIIDGGYQLERTESYADCLHYGIPGSADAKKGAFFYLAVKVRTTNKQLVGQFLVGLKGGEYRFFFNGSEKKHIQELQAYDPTPMNFLWFKEGENVLVLEIRKANKKKENVTIAVNLCDLDGDRLPGITLEPANE